MTLRVTHPPAQPPVVSHIPGALLRSLQPVKMNPDHPWMLLACAESNMCWIFFCRNPKHPKNTKGQKFKPLSEQEMKWKMDGKYAKHPIQFQIKTIANIEILSLHPSPVHLWCTPWPKVSKMTVVSWDILMSHLLAFVPWRKGWRSRQIFFLAWGVSMVSIPLASAKMVCLPGKKDRFTPRKLGS